MEHAREISPFGLRLPGELRAKLENAARIAGRSLNSEILHRLEHSFAEDVTKDRLDRIERALSDNGLMKSKKAKR